MIAGDQLCVCYAFFGSVRIREFLQRTANNFGKRNVELEDA